ncbi:hypothetical protein [Arthrobacter alpinus]|uniref:hypothetical protein n=1 Tax=Arthrobacter alpinus TaxID=656366 RepID=UPI000AAC1816|nr:hypothetical protein [Arthrobacter alpinus]
MTESHAEPVEISVRMRSGEWTPESLVELTASYQRKLFEMGAPESEVLTEVDTSEDGSASVRVSWLHQGAHTFATLNQVESPEAEHPRGDGENIPPGAVTADSKGLGAVFGDAERSAIDAPPTERAAEAEKNQQTPNAIIYTSPEGETYVEEVPQEPAD